MMADAMMTFPGEGFKRPWLPLIRMSEEVRRKIEAARKLTQSSPRATIPASPALAFPVSGIRCRADWPESLLSVTADWEHIPPPAGGEPLPTNPHETLEGPNVTNGRDAFSRSKL